MKDAIKVAVLIVVTVVLLAKLSEYFRKEAATCREHGGYFFKGHCL